MFLQQSTYIEKIFKKFYKDETHLLSTPMIVISLDVKRGSFHPREGNEAFVPKAPYLSVKEALMYLANNT